jgi:hypothetical protein
MAILAPAVLREYHVLLAPGLSLAEHVPHALRVAIVQPPALLRYNVSQDPILPPAQHPV